MHFHSAERDNIYHQPNRLQFDMVSVGKNLDKTSNARLLVQASEKQFFVGELK